MPCDALGRRPVAEIVYSVSMVTTSGVTAHVPPLARTAGGAIERMNTKATAANRSGCIRVLPRRDAEKRESRGASQGALGERVGGKRLPDGDLISQQSHCDRVRIRAVVFQDRLVVAINEEMPP